MSCCESKITICPILFWFPFESKWINWLWFVLIDEEFSRISIVILIEDILISIQESRRLRIDSIKLIDDVSFDPDGNRTWNMGTYEKAIIIRWDKSVAHARKSKNFHIRIYTHIFDIL